MNINEDSVSFSLDGASLSSNAVVTETHSGSTIELDVNGKPVTLEFEQLDDEHGRLGWTAEGRTITADVSRGGEK